MARVRTTSNIQAKISTKISCKVNCRVNSLRVKTDSLRENSNRVTSLKVKVNFLNHMANFLRAQVRVKDSFLKARTNSIQV